MHQHGGKLPIYICNDCGREVVWAESPRTGRKYLVNISHGANGHRFYIGANVHKCDRHSWMDDDDKAYEAYLQWLEIASDFPEGVLDRWVARRIPGSPTYDADLL